MCRSHKASTRAEESSIQDKVTVRNTAFHARAVPDVKCQSVVSAARDPRPAEELWNRPRLSPIGQRTSGFFVQLCEWPHCTSLTHPLMRNDDVTDGRSLLVKSYNASLACSSLHTVHESAPCEQLKGGRSTMGMVASALITVRYGTGTWTWSL